MQSISPIDWFAWPMPTDCPDAAVVI